MGDPSAGRGSKLFSLLLSLLLFSNSIAVLSLDRIESCLLKEGQQSKAIVSQKSSPIFHLHFGDPAVEVFNALNSSDIRRIKSLSKCVKLEDSTLFDDAT